MTFCFRMFSIPRILANYLHFCLAFISVFMPEIVIHDRTFSHITTEELPAGSKEYDNCRFTGCDFHESRMHNLVFLDCIFENCNLTLVKLQNVALQGAIFRNCKLLGTDFSVCNDLAFEASFEDCNLDLTSFFRRRMMKFSFTGCSLQEANFTESNLSGAGFMNCNLSRAIFNRTNLTGSDFRTAMNYSIDPEANLMKKAQFSFPGVLGLLEKYDIIV